MSVLLDGLTAESSTLARDLFEHGMEAVVLRVPDPGALSAEALSRATGLAVSRFAEPLHPVGSPAEELWTARPAPPREARLRVAPEKRAVPATRSLLRRLMASWRMPELLEGYLELLATEIVTNAVIHAGTELDVTVTYTGDAVRLDVLDRDGTLPVPRDAAPDAEGGRGLWMMQQLSLAHGIEATPGGKRVWFTVAA
jgi:anti-sigma regulatory factor (Ser/Thr protein kinase)